MKINTPNNKLPSIKQQGSSYIVNDGRQVIKCHNIATARFYLQKANVALLTKR